jgi:hypothetical protein
MDLFRDLTERCGCDVILIVSNGSILKRARECSSLSSRSRLDFIKWPHFPGDKMKRYLIENRAEIFEKATVSEEQIGRFVQLFDSSFSNLIFEMLHDRLTLKAMGEELNSQMGFMAKLKQFFP